MVRPKGPEKIQISFRVTPKTAEWLKQQAGKQSVPTWISEMYECFASFAGDVEETEE